MARAVLQQFIESLQFTREVPPMLIALYKNARTIPAVLTVTPKENAPLSLHSTDKSNPLSNQ